MTSEGSMNAPMQAKQKSATTAMSTPFQVLPRVVKRSVLVWRYGASVELPRLAELAGLAGLAGLAVLSGMADPSELCGNVALLFGLCPTKGMDACGAPV